MAWVLRILLVEDQSDDAYLFSVIAETAAPAVGVHWVKDGQEAIEYLQGRGAYWDRSRFPIPDLIVLDLRMQRFDGFELLRWLNQSGSTQIPAVVWTGSVDPQDIQKVLGLGAIGVFTKPVRFEELVSVVGRICEQGRLAGASRHTVTAVPTEPQPRATLLQHP